ncbi:MAG: AMP-binding protein [Paracoccaceae bacterium]
MGVDSLGRLNLAARVSRAFQLQFTGFEDYLLVNRRLGDWSEIVSGGMTVNAKAGNLCLAFETSGAAGEPKTVLHQLSNLRREARAYPKIFGNCNRVLSLVPPHHIFGFLFSILGPIEASWTVCDLRTKGSSALLRTARAGDALIATPFLLGLFAKQGLVLPTDITTISSTAPLLEPDWTRLKCLGMSRIVEFYGSTETAGVGWRKGPFEPFTLFSYLSLTWTATGQVEIIDEDGRRLAVPDRVQAEGSDALRVLGRLDEAVQVGGTNVFPDRVRSVLASGPGVADCVVRPYEDGRRLRAFIVPLDRDILADNALIERFIATIRRHAAKTLTPPERPGELTVGAAVPRNSYGKPIDWR